MKKLFVLMMLMGSPLLAQDLVRADPDQLAALISGEGYPVEQTTDDLGDPQLVVKTEGTSFYVQFYGCDGGHLNCTSIQLLAAFDMKDGLDTGKALTWAREQRFTSVYLDDENDPFLQMDINLEAGAVRDTVKDSLEVWRSSLSSFKDFIDW